MTTMTPIAAPEHGTSWAHQLAMRGYCRIPDLLPTATIAALEAELEDSFAEAPFCQGDFYGTRTKRFGRLLARTRTSWLLAQHPIVLDTVRSVLEPSCDRIQLNVMQAIEIHPGEVAQAPHRDQDMWHGPKGGIEYLVNVMWPLTPFRRENGGTIVWPDTHGAAALLDPPDGPGVAPECEPGDALLFLGSTLHHGGANRTFTARRGIVVGYSLGWLKPYENPWLAYPPEVARDFPESLASLAGYCQHRPNLGNFEGQCPSVLLRGHPTGPLAAIDALLPEQVAMVAAHSAAQRLPAGSTG